MTTAGLIAKELNQRGVDRLGFLVLQPVGGVGELGQLSGVAATDALLGHLRQEQYKPAQRPVAWRPGRNG